MLFLSWIFCQGRTSSGSGICALESLSTSYMDDVMPTHRQTNKQTNAKKKTRLACCTCWRTMLFRSKRLKLVGWASYNSMNFVVDRFCACLCRQVDKCFALFYVDICAFPFIFFIIMIFNPDVSMYIQSWCIFYDLQKDIRY